MNFEEIDAEARRRQAEQEGFSGQFVQGAERSLTAGYYGQEAPESLPLTGKVGRVAGTMAGFIPFAETAGAVLGAGVIGSAATGALYGLIEKPEENQTRFGNALKEGLTFGAITGAVKGLGALGRGLVGRGANEAEKAAAEAAISPEAISKPADLEAAVSAPSMAAEALTPEMAMPEMQTPETFTKAISTSLYDSMVNGWAETLTKAKPLEADAMKEASLIAETGNVEEATKSMMDFSTKANLGEVPQMAEPVGGLEVQHALQENIDQIVTKNNLSLQDVQEATNVHEPINFLMSKGVNFEDAAALTDAIVDRVETPAISEPQAVKPVVEVPSWNEIKTRPLDPGEITDMFFNVPIKGPEAIKHGLIAVEPETGAMKMTPRGYEFLKKFNPEFNTSLSQPIKGLEGLDRRALGAIRGQGFSNIDLSPAELKSAGLKMPIEKALRNDFVRLGKAEDTYQLTSKGSGMLAGGKGFNANVELKAFDMASGARVAPEDVAGIAKLHAENLRTTSLFKDLWEEVQNLGKGCEH